MALFKFTVNIAIVQRDKSEFEEVIASVGEPKFEPRQGRKRIARGGTAKPWNPGYRKKRK